MSIIVSATASRGAISSGSAPSGPSASTWPAISGWLTAGEVRRRKAKSAIFIFLGGGPSHMDTFDLKPDAPAEIRGEFKPIDTNVPASRSASTCRSWPGAPTSSPFSAASATRWPGTSWAPST